jgi:hypothetical protein
VDNHGVHKARQEHGIRKVGRHLATFGQSSGHNRYGRGGKGKLKEPKAHVNLTTSHKVVTADKGHGPVGVASTKGESKAYQVKGDGSTCSVCVARGMRVRKYVSVM